MNKVQHKLSSLLLTSTIAQLKLAKKIILMGIFVTSLSSVTVTEVRAAVPLLSGFGGPQGYGTNFLNRNDDGSVGPLDLPFGINFYGNNYSQFYLNNNGNITFNSALSAFTPNAFPGSSQPIIAPWWADVDTRNFDSGVVYYALVST